jgi:predicted membrane protein
MIYVFTYHKLIVSLQAYQRVLMSIMNYIKFLLLWALYIYIHTTKMKQKEKEKSKDKKKK